MGENNGGGGEVTGMGQYVQVDKELAGFVTNLLWVPSQNKQIVGWKINIFHDYFPNVSDIYGNPDYSTPRSPKI